jgi:sugar lactone lactonase YvrE
VGWKGSSVRLRVLSRLTVTAATAAGVLTGTAVGAAVPAAAGAATGVAAAPVAAGVLGCPATVAGSAPTLHPEGVAFDPVRSAFLVGSVTHGTVSVVRRDGTVRTLVSDPRLVTTMGVAVDVARHRLLVANADLGLADRSQPATTFNLAGVGSYDLRTGAPLFYVDLAALTPGGQHFGNDVAVAPDGTLYVTDSLAGAVYRVDRAGHASVLVQDASLAGTPETGFGLNGIVWAGNGVLVGALSAARALVRIPLAAPARFARTTVDAPIGAPDGLAITGRGQLALVDNTQANRIVRLRSPDGWRTAAVTASTPWVDHVPTTLATTPCGLYALDGELDVLLGGGSSDQFTIGRIT